ncbi:hypothetical protein ACFPRL_25090 [Pseudoclavibacter helvolus]
MVESAYQRETWSVVIPRRKPYGLIFWPITCCSPSRPRRAPASPAQP